MKRTCSSKERRSKILNILRDKRKITVAEMASLFQVSEVSIRNDLQFLEEKELLLRVKGGAVNINTANESEDIAITKKQQSHSDEKRIIGKVASEFIKEGETIIIDSGTTTLEVAKNLEKFNNLTIITNGINVAEQLAQYDRFSVIVLGGYMRSVSLSTVGMTAESTLRNFFVDKLFLGVDSFNLEKGLSTPNAEEASLNRAMIDCAKEVIAVFDSSKLEKRSFAFIAAMDKINVIITDNGISEEYREKIEHAGINLIIAGEGNGEPE
ncbi:MAG: DeoR/GlpR family DNA-binding transcription regulator [Bacteroidales bacterium]|jgi:DeoR/GlpR family transcriptional regulator of sugar metabolism|nr:DeoR/GlpR family DNA-binding transcription regulator [Bacteroidales bacterium]MCI2121319.1 DeoR/GlpR family DNA-binding transcription regulator [Bacteroidales bacterium]MCI2145931.1 DeoR/GlpR family DNA-binding transcription regulator [Bacteroidales bacterium]